MLTHRNAMSVCEMVQELSFVQPGESRPTCSCRWRTRSRTPSQLAPYDLGTTIIYFGGDTKKVIEELVEIHPTYLPSVPRIFEKLYTAGDEAQEQASDEDRARFKQAVKLGVEVRGAGTAASRCQPRWSRLSRPPTSASTRA